VGPHCVLPTGHGSLRPWSARAAEPRRGRGRAWGEQDGTGTAARDLQRQEMRGHKDVHWSHTPPYSLLLSQPARSNSLPPPGPAARAQPPASRGHHPATLLRLCGAPPTPISARGFAEGCGEMQRLASQVMQTDSEISQRLSLFGDGSVQSQGKQRAPLPACIERNHRAQCHWLDGARLRARAAQSHRPVGNTVDSVLRPVPSPMGCSLSAACRWGRTSAASPEGTSAARTGKLACASPAAPARPRSGCAPCLAAAGAAAWQCYLRLQRCCRCCLCAPAQTALRAWAARVACASASSSRVIWLSARTLHAECILHAAC
jgi:hypothetical protein